jgi:hypothetical protein
MARSLILSLDGQEFPVSLVKLDRDKLYGTIEIEAFDEKGNEATLKVLAADGKTLIDKGGTALSTVNEEGVSVSRTQLKALDADGEEIKPVPSSFDAPNILKTATADEYLSQIVKSIYMLQPAGDSDLDYLQSHLASNQIYKFPFSYRGGLEYDSAFLVGGADSAFMIVGKQAGLQFVKLNQASSLDAVEEQEISGDELDFDLL